MVDVVSLVLIVEETAELIQSDCVGWIHQKSNGAAFIMPGQELFLLLLSCSSSVA